jgi:hypothetical protein
MSLSGKVFLFVIVAVGIVGLVGLMSFISLNNSPSDSTVNSSANSYYNTNQIVNQTMNKTLQVGAVGGMFLSPIPMLVMIFVVACGCYLFLLVVKKK